MTIPGPSHIMVTVGPRPVSAPRAGPDAAGLAPAAGGLIQVQNWPGPVTTVGTDGPDH